MPDRQFVLCTGNAQVILKASRRSHRSVHALIAKLGKDPKHAGLVQQLCNNFLVENSPARPGSDDDLASDGWSTEF